VHDLNTRLDEANKTNEKLARLKKKMDRAVELAQQQVTDSAREHSNQQHKVLKLESDLRKLNERLEESHNSSSLVDGEKKRLEGELAADREKLRRLEEKNAKLRDDLEKEQRDKSNLEAKMNSFLSSFK